MKRELIGFSFCLILLFISCSDNQENEVIPAPELNTIKIEKPVYDSLAVALNNEAVELGMNISLGLESFDLFDNVIALLDSAINIDPSYYVAKSSKLTFLFYSDSIAAKEYFFQLESDSPPYPFHPFTKGLVYEFYGLNEIADSMYQNALNLYLSVKTDTMNNTQEVFYLDALIPVYYALGDFERVDSVQNIINNEFTIEFKEYSNWKDRDISRSEFIDMMFEQFREEKELR